MVILSAMLMLVQAAERGALSVGTVAAFMVGIVFALAVLAPREKEKKEKSGAGIERVLFGIGLPITGLLIYAINSSNGMLHQFIPILTYLLAIFVVLIGLLIVLRGLFK